MRSRTAKNLGKEKIHQLLAAVGSRPAEDTTQVEVEDYNWNEPHYFNSEQLVKLNCFAEKVATAVAEKFTDSCRSEFDVTITSTTQHFVDEFLKQPSDDEHKDYYLAIGTNREHLCGLVGIPEKTALVWATQLLGDSGSEEGDSGRDLSQLEESLLFDLTSALVEVFSSLYKTSDFQPAESIVKGQWPLELPATEEVFKITFNVKKAVSNSNEKETQAYFLIPCSRLELIAGKSSQAAGESSAGYTSRAVLSHLQEMPVIVTAQLASTVLTFEEVMNLQANDILLLDKKVDQPVELVVDDRSICFGWPAKSDGKYAVTITATAFGDTAQN